MAAYVVQNGVESLQVKMFKASWHEASDTASAWGRFEKSNHCPGTVVPPPRQFIDKQRRFSGAHAQKLKQFQALQQLRMRLSIEASHVAQHEGPGWEQAHVLASLQQA